jgi:predicted O-methyltransferase YrrM
MLRLPIADYKKLEAGTYAGKEALWMLAEISRVTDQSLDFLVKGRSANNARR